jgi:nucleoside-diphosphate-sugar epimerase
MVTDFAVAQCAAIIALCGSLLWYLRGGPASFEVHAGSAMRYYIATMVPFAAVFPLSLFVNRCYARSLFRGDRRARFSFLQAFLVVYAAFALAHLFLRQPNVTDSAVGVGFLALASAGTIWTSWFRSTVDQTHSLEGVPPHWRGTASAEPPVLVIGGAGYIGSVLVRRLIASGRKVRVLDNLVYGHAPLQALSGHPNFEFLSGDCRNIKSVVRAVEGVDTVIHLAAIVGDPACEQDRQTALETNYAATRMLIEVAKGARVSRLIFASTCSVYGASDQLMDETSATEPISLYAQTKVQSERALLEAASESFHPIIVRLATVFGHSYRPRFDLVVNLLTARALQEGLITIYNGQQWRPFIHVRDVANGIVMLLNTPVSIVGGQVFNLGDSSLNYTLEQIAENIRQIFPGTKVAHVDNDDRRNYRVSFDKIQRLVGFQASVSLADGIHELRTAFERRHLQDYKLAVYSNQCFLQRTGGVHLPNEVDTYVMAAFSRHFTALAEAERRPA